MARRKIVEEHVNHERWLVSYADFITLLFAFFVVMYSISQVNESKYRVLSNTLNAAFNQPEVTIQPVQVGEQVKSNPISLIQLDAMAIKDKDGQVGGETEGEMPEEFKEISSKIEEALKGLIEQKLVTLRGNELWLEIELSSSLLFDSGDAALRGNESLQLLGQIAAILREQNNPVRVEGFTDNVPINTARYPSNWELSSARAASVVQFFMEEGLDPNRMVAVGYGEYQPIADNETPEGRSRNRRVVLMISKTGELRPTLKPVAPAEAVKPEPAQESSASTPVAETSAAGPAADTAPVNIAPVLPLPVPGKPEPVAPLPTAQTAQPAGAPRPAPANTAPAVAPKPAPANTASPTAAPRPAAPSRPASGSQVPVALPPDIFSMPTEPRPPADAKDRKTP